MKTRIFQFIALGGLLVLALLVIAGWFLLYRDTSIYAPGFTQRAFDKVRPGMTQSEVRQLLGEPLGVRDRAWYYSDPSDYGVYHAKIVVFSEKLLVSRKVSYLMSD
jgi:outer membrane protein assembly factor BamE (lipoprotein component of BamABCDE complex)